MKKDQKFKNLEIDNHIMYGTRRGTGGTITYTYRNRWHHFDLKIKMAGPRFFDPHLLLCFFVLNVAYIFSYFMVEMRERVAFRSIYIDLTVQ